LLSFIKVGPLAINSLGTGFLDRKPVPYPRYPGPLIMKLNGTGSTVNMDVSAGFDLILVDN